MSKEKSEGQIIGATVTSILREPVEKEVKVEEKVVLTEEVKELHRLYDDIEKYLDKDLDDMYLFPGVKGSLAGLLIFMRENDKITREVFETTKEYATLLSAKHLGIYEQGIKDANKKDYGCAIMVDNWTI